MPWQRLVAEIGGEIDPDTGLPAYRDVVVTVPRQCGKTMLILAWELQRALGWGSPQRIVYSAQTGNDARKKLVEDQLPILEPRKAKLGISQILKGMGNEAVVFQGGSRLVLMASGEDAGHGKTVDLGVKDEFFADFDDRRDQALAPAMLTKPAAQVLTASTAGTDASVPLNKLVARGRQAVDAGKRSGIAYFEWSADPLDDPDDPETWWACMPALGHTITEDVVRHAREVTFADTPGEFLRACLNIPTRNEERLIPASTWDLVNSPDASPSGHVTFALDQNPERSASAITAVGERVIEVIEHRPQTGWVIDSLLALCRNGEAVAVDKTGPAGSMIAPLERAGVKVIALSAQDTVAACAGIFDAIADRTVMFRRHPSMDNAVAGVAKRVVGDAWAFARKSSAVDISPLMAAAIGLHVAAGDGPSTYEERGLLTL